MLTKLKRLLKSETVADIDEALAEIDLDALRSTLAEANRRRADLLLSGSDDQVLAAEKQIEVARLAIDRADAAKGELETRLAAAKTRELDQAFDRQWKEADAEAAAAFDFVKAKVVPAVRAIEEALKKKEESDRKIRDLNRVVMENLQHDSAAGRSAPYTLSVMERIRDADILPSWLAGRFERHSQPH